MRIAVVNAVLCWLVASTLGVIGHGYTTLEFWVITGSLIATQANSLTD